MQIMRAADAPRYGAGNLREGPDFSEVVLLHGRENALDNFRLYYSGGTNGEWKTPRHRHNFEQIRLPLAGEFEYAKDKRLPAGWVAYFPESVHYGPQIRLPGLSMITLQFGGASRSGYMSEAQRRRGYDELRAKGTFEKGAYTWIDENGRRHNQDAFEAIWEHLMGRKLDYPTPRYDSLIIMNPDAFGWMPERGTPGASRKWLGTFTERGVRTGFLRLDAGAAATIGSSTATEILFLVEGELTRDGTTYDRHTGFCADPGESIRLVAAKPSTLFCIELPSFD